MRGRRNSRHTLFSERGAEKKGQSRSLMDLGSVIDSDEEIQKVAAELFDVEDTVSVMTDSSDAAQLRNKNSLVGDVTAVKDFAELVRGVGRRLSASASTLKASGSTTESTVSFHTTEDVDLSVDSSFGSSAESLHDPFEEEEMQAKWKDIVNNMKDKPKELRMSLMELETLRVHMGIEIGRLQKIANSSKSGKKHKESATRRVEIFNEFLGNLDLAGNAVTHGEMRSRLARLKEVMYPYIKTSSWRLFFHCAEGFVEITKMEGKTNRDEWARRRPSSLDRIMGR